MRHYFCPDSSPLPSIPSPYDISLLGLPRGILQKLVEDDEDNQQAIVFLCSLALIGYELLACLVALRCIESDRQPSALATHPVLDNEQL